MSSCGGSAQYRHHILYASLNMNDLHDDLPLRVREMLPGSEPTPPNGKFLLQVSYPYIPKEAKEAVLKAIDEGTISSATKVVEELEVELCKYFGVSFAIACSSGYSALVMGLKLASIQTGADVLMPSFTMVAVVNAVLAVGANPVFVDCAEGQLNPSLAEYEKSLTSKSQCLIVTHTYGVPADCLGLQKFCTLHNLIFIEDIAEAIGTEYNGRLVGTFGDFACASLYANKTITAGDGGFVLSTHAANDLKQRAKSYANHGFSQNYHFVHFESSGNYKMSGLQAAFVKPAVSKIREIVVDRNRISRIYRQLLEGFPGITLMQINPYGLDAPWMFGIMFDSKKTREEIRRKLAEAGIETRNFFFPLHLQPLVMKIKNKKVENLPCSEQLGATGIYLPTFYGITESDIYKVCKALKDCLQNRKL